MSVTNRSFLKILFCVLPWCLLFSCNKVVTVQEFNRIEPDMPYRKVKEIIADPGTQIYSVYFHSVFEEYPEIITGWQWRNKNGGEVHIYFRNDRMYEKKRY